MAGVDPEHMTVQVACAKEWTASRRRHMADAVTCKVPPYDWTYTTAYRGTVGDGFEVRPLLLP